MIQRATALCILAACLLGFQTYNTEVEDVRSDNVVTRWLQTFSGRPRSRVWSQPVAVAAVDGTELEPLSDDQARDPALHSGSPPGGL